MLLSQAAPSYQFFGRGQHEDHLYENILILDQGLRRFHLKIILSIALPIPFSTEQNQCIFCREHHEKHFCEIILNLDNLFRRRCHLKIFLIWSSGDHCFICLFYLFGFVALRPK